MISRDQGKREISFDLGYTEGRVERYVGHLSMNRSQTVITIFPEVKV